MYIRLEDGQLKGTLEISAERNHCFADEYLSAADSRNMIHCDDKGLVDPDEFIFG